MYAFLAEHHAAGINEEAYHRNHDNRKDRKEFFIICVELLDIQDL